ncbi:uncharacterized protein LOC124804943 [Schistocerca piceifrons]|uniref:uncharacterized protein LOC124804943 n=1 Tax=Schistocerca piceifrons TaxID=274613 RepID=UPI001F5F993E|nr:uncharacterized protein LOC124804943 [Schistocerca piceifrons]
MIITVALKHATKDMPNVTEHINQTVTFLQVIVNWWKIVNVRSVFEGQRSNDPYREAIRKTTDNQVTFLNNLCHWLKVWRVSVPMSGALTSQTFQSLILTTESFLQIIPYLFEKYDIDYILLGKFQSDDLEGRFGCYRQLSGANYYISYIQVLENERKLRLKNDVLFAAQNDNVHLKHIIPAQQQLDCNIDISIFSDIMDITFGMDDVPPNMLPILTYIGGYAARKAIQKSKCDKCTEWLQLNKEVEVDSSYNFVKELDRGKLTLPTETVVITVGIVWHTVSLLVNDFLQQFMSCGKQLSISQKICMSKVVKAVDNAECMCLLHNTLLSKLQYVSLCANRILINNFEKMYNDKASKSKVDSRKVKKLRTDT